MEPLIRYFLLVFICVQGTPFVYAELKISAQTEECLGCHSELHPGLVASWLKSRHS